MPKRKSGFGWLILACVCAVLAMFILEAGKAWADAGPGDSGQNVTEVQYILRSYGYSLPVDGKYGPKTTKAVKHFQKANDLLPDGIVGPITMEALEGAVRIPGGNIPTTNPAGLRGMPFAPDGLDNCAEMNYYRTQAGLPDQFSDQPRSGPRSQWGYGWRESNCRNDVGNACCHGYWGLHAGNINNQWSYGPLVKAHCEVYSVSDYRGNNPLQKQKAACFAKVLFDISGLSPWRL